MTPRVSLPACCFVQIADLLAELADERSTSESASQLLETETSERLRLEKDLKELQAHIHTGIKNMLGGWRGACYLKQIILTDKLPLLIDVHVQAKFDGVKKQLESQEMEVMEARLMKTSELNGELDDDDDDAGQ